MPERSLRDWLSLIESRHPAGMELGLERVAAVAKRLELTAPATRTVIVAGTNGKGSCVRTLEHYAVQSRLRVGAYTSPHLVRFNERVRVDGGEADDETLCSAFAAVEDCRGETPLTYFETATLAALVSMARANLDLAILEVGLGGRFDAVNIVDADLAIITSIALDHTTWLGEDREAIGYEKACVARPGHPVVCADRDPPISVVRYLEQLGCRALYLGRDFEAVSGERALELRLVDSHGGEESVTDLPVPGLPVDSVAAAFQALPLLGMAVRRDLIAATCRDVGLPGRCQTLEVEGKRLLLDVAHNPAAAHYLAGRLQKEPGKVLAVAAIMADKDLEGFLDALVPVVDDWYLGNLTDMPRSLSADAFGKALYARGVGANLFAGLEQALESALARAGARDTVLVCGSFYTVSAILERVSGSRDHV